MKHGSPEENTVSPYIQSGFNRRKGAIISGYVFLTIIYSVVYVLLKDSGSYLTPADHFCEKNVKETCSRPDLFAFQVAAGIMMFYMGSLGFYTWHISKNAHTKVPNNPEGRLFGYLEEADKLNTAIFICQTWDFFASLLIPEHRTLIFLAHHALSGFTAWYSLNYQVVHHYSIFFGGISEVSSIFLVFCDLDVYFPAKKDSSYATFIFACQALFTLCFFAYRVVGWWVVSYRLWHDARYAWENEIVNKYRPGRTYFLPIFLSLDTSLGLLQLYWAGLIVQKVSEIMADDS